jgi:hypothetical protein
VIRVYAFAAAASILALPPLAQERERGARGGPDPRDLRVLAPGDVPQEQGEPGTEVPDARSPRRAWPVVHQDTSGSALQRLVDLEGASEEGFVVLWSDGRAGAPVHFYRHLPRLFEPGIELGGEQRVAAAFSGNSESQGAVALLGARALFAWRTSHSGPGCFELRGLDAGGEPSPVARLSAPPAPRGEGRAAPVLGRAATGPAPDPAVLPTGGAVTWTFDGRVLVQLFDDELAPRGEALVLHEGVPACTRAPSMRVRADGPFACAWNVGPLLYLAGGAAGEGTWRTQPCTGALLDWTVDPAGSGFWLCLRRSGQVWLQRIAAQGDLVGDPRPLPVDAAATIDLASGTEGIGLVFELGPASAEDSPADGSASTPSASAAGPQLLWLDPEGAPLGPAVALPGSASGDTRALIAEADGAWLAAFDRDEARGGGITLAWLHHGTAELAQGMLLGRSEASANQDLGAVATAGARVLVAWVDSRSGPPRVFARGQVDGRFEREVALPVRSDEAAALEVQAGYQVAVGLHPDGRALVAWFGAGPRGPQIQAQALDAALAPLSPEVALDPEHAAGVFSPPALATLRGDNGYALAWVRDVEGTTEPSLWVQRLSLLGRPLGPARRMADGLIKDPALCRLDDGRVLLAWSALVPAVGSRLRAHFLSEVLEPEGRELVFDTMFRGWDRRPAVAPGPEGGFALAWCAGADEERDVFFRCFDSAGRPAGRPVAVTTRAGTQDNPTLARLADGYALAWVDGLGTGDRVRMVRISPRSGPKRTVRLGGGDLTASFQASPVLVPHPEGLALVWTHNGRGLGRDVGLCVLGQDFDQIPTAPR